MLSIIFMFSFLQNGCGNMFANVFETAILHFEPLHNLIQIMNVIILLFIYWSVFILTGHTIINCLSFWKRNFQYVTPDLSSCDLLRFGTITWRGSRLTYLANYIFVFSWVSDKQGRTKIWTLLCASIHSAACHHGRGSIPGNW